MLHEVQRGTREGLVAVRDRLAGLLEVCEAKEAASLARELRAVVLALAALPESKDVSPLDEILARRQRRAAGGSA